MLMSAGCSRNMEVLLRKYNSSRSLSLRMWEKPSRGGKSGSPPPQEGAGVEEGRTRERIRYMCGGERMSLERRRAGFICTVCALCLWRPEGVRSSDSGLTRSCEIEVSAKNDPLQ